MIKIGAVTLGVTLIWPMLSAAVGHAAETEEADHAVISALAMSGEHKTLAQDYSPLSAAALVAGPYASEVARPEPDPGSETTLYALLEKNHYWEERRDVLRASIKREELSSEEIDLGGMISNLSMNLPLTMKYQPSGCRETVSRLAYLRKLAEAASLIVVDIHADIEWAQASRKPSETPGWQMVLRRKQALFEALSKIPSRPAP